jgi:hypothetical protein
MDSGVLVLFDPIKAPYVDVAPSFRCGIPVLIGVIDRPAECRVLGERSTGVKIQERMSSQDPFLSPPFSMKGPSH